ncbi:DUF3422 family protein [Sinorhizobium meliloti]|uniref:DUF3422 domain-containing protein n=1 Tax=Rhizobium meliloti TaxID=382 RepID=UPI000FDCDC4A|nr:DUF3422 domain-containing protein [Sinorhizobium meliloti]RVI98420.1 DUF3422 family protein [Sinorhizobium meliloti]
MTAARLPAIGCEHPMRRELHGELHARPSLYFDGEADVWHCAVVFEGEPPRVPSSLLAGAGLSESRTGRHGITSFGEGRLKWELHTEFASFTLVAGARAAPTPPSELLALCDEAGGLIISAARVMVRRGDQKVIGKAGEDFVASKVGGGDAEVHSTFRLNESGFVELYLLNRTLNAYRIGRMVRRLLEIETYRMMALLATPIARETIEKIAMFNSRLELITDHMRSSPKVDKSLLAEVTRLSSEVLNFSARARHRFGATRAYSELVVSRIGELREERVEQRQRLGTFIDRRFQPAIRFFNAADRRLGDLEERVSLAGDLLRTTVQVQLEDQNASLLTSVEERTRAQVQIQQAVEGFSVIAITYYAVGLAKVCIESLTALGLDVHLAKPALLALVPGVMLLVWKAVHSVRRRVTPHG